MRPDEAFTMLVLVTAAGVGGLVVGGAINLVAHAVLRVLGK